MCRFMVLALSVFSSCVLYAIEAQYTEKALNIDGRDNEVIWSQIPWNKIDKPIIGNLPQTIDFSGKYKVAWHESALFLLVEINDDVFFDQHTDPLQAYWNDDCLEIFIDEDRSGGDHLYNFNAFAYHVSLTHDVVDIVGKNTEANAVPALLNHHIKSQYLYLSSNRIQWELAISIYPDTYEHTSDKNMNQPISLKAGKSLGFMLAYCDNDGSIERESFIGSYDIPPKNGDKNLGYITADVFDVLHLMP